MELKEAKEICKNLTKIEYDVLCGYQVYRPHSMTREEVQAIETVLNELECMKLSQVACCTAQNCEALTNCIKLHRELDNSVSKDKIKEKLSKLEKEFDFYAGRDPYEWEDAEFDGEQCKDIAIKIGVLKELLEGE